MSKPTRREWKHVLDINAPEGIDRSKLPSFMTKEPRKGAGLKRGKQEETSWLHTLIKPFKKFSRYTWPAGSVWLARNNNGAFKRGRNWFHYGLGAGTADAVGLTVVTITPEMVGTMMAQFTVFEAKSDDGTLQENQECFADNMRKAGARVLTGSPGNPPRIIPPS